MRHVTITGEFFEFKAKAPKEGQAALLCNKLCVTGTDAKMIAGLCKNSKDAYQAMQSAAAVTVKGKLELPCDGQLALVRSVGKDDGEALDATGVTFRKIVMDFSEDAETEIHYEERFTREAAMFALEHLGAAIEITVTPAQGTLPGAKEEAA